MSNSGSRHTGTSESMLSYTFSPRITFLKNTIELSDDAEGYNSTFKNNDIKSLDNQLDSELYSCMKEFEDIFYSICMDEYIEDGYISNSQKLYSTISKSYGKVVAGMFLNKIYMKNSRNSKIIKSLLFVLGQIDPADLRGVEEGILAFAILNKDYEIKDLALQCFEKWNSKRYLELLKSIDTGVEYLQNYIKSIIEDIESE